MQPPETQGKPVFKAGLDPSPRTYSDTVTLLRRATFAPDRLPSQTPAQIEAWLLEDALAAGDLLEFYQEFLWRMLRAGMPVERSSLHVGTLHPQVLGYVWMWNSDDGFCDEGVIDQSVRMTDAYRRNPLSRVIDHGERFRARLDPSRRAKHGPLLGDLAEQGYTEYAAFPLRSGGANHNAATVATRQQGGYSDEEFGQIERLLRIFALHVERHIAERISQNIASTYLGSDAGRQVLDGSIRRGSGAAVEAIIWASDLRGFTRLSDQMTDGQLTAVLNAYFECLASAVIAQGGDVLKFIGDGMLAVFPFAAFSDETATAQAALSATQQALGALDALNADPAALAGVTAWRPLQTGIALHRGTVFFGNVGAPDRLDFTVIGKAVNTASRVEALCKTTQRPVLVTAPVASLASHDLASLGFFELAGLEQPLELFTFR